MTTIPNQAREGQTFAGQSLLARYASFVKLPHTLFALPFAGVGAVLASYTFRHNITIVIAKPITTIARRMNTRPTRWAVRDPT